MMLALGAGAASLAVAPAAADEILASVNSTAYNGYARAKQADGTFKPETYAFGQGHYLSGQMHDPSIEGFPFLKLVQTLAPYLARQNYLPAPGPAQTDLIIVVHWGTTVPYNDATYGSAVDSLQKAQISDATAGATAEASPGQQSSELTGALMEIQAEKRQRDLANARNAALLGYQGDMNRYGDLARLAGFGSHYHDLVADVEEDRYFVILTAYDYRALSQEKKRKLLWITRVSIVVRGNRFDEQLGAMLAIAAPYFGHDLPGLVRQTVPEGKVKIGEPKVIGIAPEPHK